jgi:hypothetical protein
VGRIEATDTTFWFGFKDDVVIRVTAADGGSQANVRSPLRGGDGDAGYECQADSCAYLDALRS